MNTPLTCGKLVKGPSARGEWEGKQIKHEPAYKIDGFGRLDVAVLVLLSGTGSTETGTPPVQLLVSPHLGVERIGAQQRVPPQAVPPLVPPVLHFRVHQSVRLENRIRLTSPWAQTCF